jgi:hypothetical protein
MNNNQEEVKMANFDEFKKNAAKKAGIFAGRAAKLARAAAEKTKVTAKIGKLNAEILAEKDAIRKASQELGKIYYEYFKVDPHEPMKEACARIDAAYAAIAAKRAEIEELKAEAPGLDIEIEIERDTEEPCSCGETAEKAAEAVCDCAKEAAEEACDCVKEAAEEVCDCAKEAADAAEDAAEKICDCAEDVKPE